MEVFNKLSLKAFFRHLWFIEILLVCIILILTSNVKAQTYGIGNIGFVANNQLNQSIFVNSTNINLTSSINNYAGNWLIGYLNNINVFRCGTSLYGVVSCTSNNNYPLYLGNDDATSRMVFNDDGSLGFVGGNKFIEFYLGSLFAETLRLQINNTAIRTYTDTDFNNYNLFNAGVIRSGTLLSNYINISQSAIIPHQFTNISDFIFGKQYKNERENDIRIEGYFLYRQGANDPASILNITRSYFDGTNNSIIRSYQYFQPLNPISSEMAFNDEFSFFVPKNYNWSINYTQPASSNTFFRIKWIEVIDE